MSTVNLVPEDVKQAFNDAFRARTRARTIADLMREAVERAERKQLHHQAICAHPRSDAGMHPQ